MTPPDSEHADGYREHPRCAARGFQQCTLSACGTLILIALIVLFFGQRGDDELKNEVRQLGEEVKQLRTTVGALHGKVDRQTAEIGTIRKSLEKKAKK